ncbi:MAG: hypothetical protein NT034_04410 [Candidatus Magasanikbacteria bacterium]|nr:hypothetical protein [Candidatus Magasanikbacteria bacterium]
MVLTTNAPFGPNRMLTDFGRHIANSATSDHAELREELLRSFGPNYAVRSGLYHAAVATANLLLGNPPNLLPDQRLGNNKDDGESASYSDFFASTLSKTTANLVFVVGRKKAFIQMLGHESKARELRSCQSVVVFLDTSYTVVSTEIFAPPSTRIVRLGWKKRMRLPIAA